MRTSQWPLVAFTILTQISVGSFLVLGVVHRHAVRRKGMAQADRLSDLALLSILPVLGLAILASLLHLGTPLNAPRAVANLSTSWLSREILSVVIFALLAAVFVLIQWRKIGWFALRNGIAWVAAVVGVVLVYSMSRVYMLSAQPAWNTLVTPVSFFTTTLLLGCLAVGAALVANHEILQRRGAGGADELLGDSLRGIAVVSIVLLGVELAALTYHVAHLALSGPAGLSSLELMLGPYGPVLTFRVILAFVGAGLFVLYLYRSAGPGETRVRGHLAYGGFAVVLVAELLGRFLFYATQVRVGV
jgi:anaerobic dimethyl sulfoxide reductase subunit C (anchor subunit)